MFVLVLLSLSRRLNGRHTNDVSTFWNSASMGSIAADCHHNAQYLLEVIGIHRKTVFSRGLYSHTFDLNSIVHFNSYTVTVPTTWRDSLL